jgi:hypothetical protein
MREALAILGTVLMMLIAYGIYWWELKHDTPE